LKNGDKYFLLISLRLNRNKGSYWHLNHSKVETTPVTSYCVSKFLQKFDDHFL